METLKKLELIRLIKELDFVESEFNYKSEMIREMDIEFRKEVENILNSKPALKDLFTKCAQKNHINQSHRITVEHETQQEFLEVVTVEKDQKLKSLYRTIVKTTHPDVSRDDNLKEIYIQATKAYEENNLYPIISICNKLNIPFEIDEKDYESIKNQILALKMRSEFLETTYTWQWHINPNIDSKNEIIFNFIQSQIY